MSEVWQDFVVYHWGGFVFHIVWYLLGWVFSHWGKICEQWG